MEIDELGPGARNEILFELVETSPHVLYVFTPDWDELVFVNERYEELWGRTIEALEADSRDFLEGVHPEDRQLVMEAMETISSGEAVELEYRVNEAEDYGRWVHVHGRPIRDDDGDIVRVAGYAREITAEKAQQAELERKNERLESFASVVSHDLRNPLNVAMGNLELAREECESEHLDTVDRALGRMADLIEHLLDLARNNREHPEPVAIDAIAGKCWEDVATADATLTVTADRTIEADVNRLQQLFENLYRNAVQHGGPDVTVTVGDLPDGFYVEDDGPGIPGPDRERVFESGFTTDESGSGLGLAIVATIAKEHGWDVAVTSGESGGARIEVTDVEPAN